MYDDDFQSTTTSTDSLPFIHSPNDSTGSLPPVEQSEDSAPIQKTIKFGSRITVNYPVKIYQKKRNFDPRSHITAKDLFVLKDPSIKDAEENFKKNNNYLIDDATLDILYPNWISPPSHSPT